MSAEKVTIRLTGLNLKIRSAIAPVEDEDGPDIERIVADLEADLQGDEVTVAFRKGLRLLVEREARRVKREAIHRAQEDARRMDLTANRSTRRTEAAKQLADVTATHAQLVAERFFSLWKETPTGRKFLGECTALDLHYSQQRNMERSGHLQAAAAADERLAVALVQAGCTTVRELGYESAARAVAGGMTPPQ